MTTDFIKTLLMATLCIGAMSTAIAQTPSTTCADAPNWTELTGSQRKDAINQTFKQRDHLSDECFSAMVSSIYSADRKLLADSFGVIFSSRAAKGSFSQELLFSLFKNNRLVSDKNIWGKIIDAWSSASVQPVYAVLAANSEGGKLPAADTLYSALDAAGRLDAHELLRFGRVKCLLGNYRAAALIYCRVIAEDKRLELAAFTPMGQLFADADSAVMAAALGDFERCAFSLPSADTALFRDKLAEMYNRGGLFEKEIALLSAFDIQSAPSGRKLADAARGHFTRRRYRYAAAGAAAAYARLEEKDQRTGIAFVAYQSYMQLGARDSALVWLRRAEAVGNKDARIQAVALNQETGHLDEAAALIDSLPASLSKDTLLVRQRLFSGEAGKALNLIVASKSTSWVMSPRDRMLWRGRCMVFGGQVYEAAPVLDSIKFMASWHGSQEILRYRYWIQKLEDDQGALESWGKLEYLIYTGDLTAAYQYLQKTRLSGESGEMLAVRLARALSASARFQEALETLELVDKGNTSGVSGGVDYGINLNLGDKGGKGGKDGKDGKGKDVRTPEYLYFKAEMLKESGRHDDARVVANKILVDYPADIFAQKARILLSRI